MMARMEVSSRLTDGQAVVMLSGELDVTDAALVATVLTTVASGRQQIVVDLTKLAFIDSSGLAALVNARQHARRAGSDLLLAAPRPQVLRMLAITRLIDVFAVHARVDDAAGSAGRIPGAIAPQAGNPAIPAMRSQTSFALLAAGDAA